MQRFVNRPGIWIAAVVTLFCVALIAVIVVRAEPSDDQRAVTVMTRNLYVGGDITRPLRAAQDRTGRDAILALGHANHELRRIVDHTSFAVRSELLADEIAAARPDLLGLQEVALWRHGPMQPDKLGQLNATEVDYDFLSMLTAALDERGAPYDVVHAQQGSDVEAPAFIGNPFAGTATAGRDIRLTVRDVILVRRNSGLRITESGGGQYRHRLEVTIAGTVFSFIRGYALADFAIGSKRLRFATTHLESQSGDVAAGQAQELVQGLTGRTPLTTIVACDCNSDPRGGPGGRGEAAAPSTTYRLLTQGDDLEDLWLQQPASAGRGFTAGLSELVNDPTADGFSRRLDLMLARSAESSGLYVSHGQVTGDELTDRDSRTGLWPSDHAGVVLHLGLD
jgi:hypothetical protein